jgi:hypothetical protein
MTITLTTRAAKPKISEHQHQKAVVQWAALVQLQYKELALLYAVPNGGQRHAAVAAKLKAEGVRAGVPDLCLPVARGDQHALYVEMKTEGGRTTPPQRAFIEALKQQQNAVVVCFSADQAIRAILDYLESGK